MPPSGLSKRDRIIGRTNEVVECNYNSDSGYYSARSNKRLAAPVFY
jgi:hypothetical protein